MDILTRQSAEARLAKIRPHFYVYQLVGPDGLPFYVGQGRGERVFFHEEDIQRPETFHKHDLIQLALRSSIGLRYRIFGPLETQSEAYELETHEIARWGRRINGGILANLTDGGPGAFGAQTGSPDAYGERGIANRYFLQLVSARSIPIRPITPKSRLQPLYPDRVRVQLTPRQAGALVASAAVNGIELVAGCEIPRRMQLQQDGKVVSLAIERGAGKSILETGTAVLVEGQPPTFEVFRLGTAGVKAVIEACPGRVLGLTP